MYEKLGLVYTDIADYEHAHLFYTEALRYRILAWDKNALSSELLDSSSIRVLIGEKKC